MAKAPKAEEFFYTSDDRADSIKRDADLHNPILRAVDYPIDEKIMQPIRERRRAAYLAEQQATQKAARLKSQWARAKARSLALLQKWDESKHPRVPAGSGDHSGEFGHAGGGADKKPPAAVSGYNEGVKAAGNIDPVRDRWVKESPIKTMDDVVRAAPIAQKAFGEAGRKIAAKLGVTFKDPGPKTQKKDEAGKFVDNPKGIARILEKIEERENAGKPTPIARITDTARGTFVLNRTSDAQKVIDELSKTHEIVVENWRTIPASWYTDRTILFRDRETGLIGELQLTHPELLRAKDSGGGHELYEKSRSLPKGEYEVVRLNLKMRALYGKVLDSLHADWKEIDGRQYFRKP